MSPILGREEHAACRVSEVACSGIKIYCSNRVITVTPNGKLRFKVVLLMVSVS